MKLIKLDAIASTNSYLRSLSTHEKLEDFTVVVTDRQLEGKGQMGTSWEVEAGKNLTFSVFKKISCLNNEEQFYVSMATSLAIFKALETFNIRRLGIKWPNDILSANQKICGILIENIVQNNQMQAAVIGIGLNVNQTDFGHLQSASSMKLLNGVTYQLEEILHSIVAQLKVYAVYVEDRRFDELKEAYERKLFRKDKPSTFKDQEGNLIMGFIKGVSHSGKLQVLLEDHVLKDFDLKELKLLY